MTQSLCKSYDHVPGIRLTLPAVIEVVEADILDIIHALM
jgi:hypothetical protein